MVTVGDIAIAKKLVPVDCEPWLIDIFTTETFYIVLSIPESTLIFCEWHGLMDVKAPKCTKTSCAQRNTTSHFVRKKIGVWAWRFRCSCATASMFRSSLFYKSSYGAGEIRQMMWFCAAKVPVGVTSALVFVFEHKEVYTWFATFGRLVGTRKTGS